LRVLILTGEVSGDKNASYLVRKLSPYGWDFYALGGENLKKAGAKIICDSSEISVVGFQEAISKIGKINSIKRKVILEALLSDLIIAVDFPGFNLPLSKKLKSLNKKVIYYISPQVWAWGKWRIRDLVKLDAVLCILPFEEDFLRSYGVNAFFVGHPLVKYDEEVPEIPIENDGPIFGFLPGSRKEEIRRHIPRMLRIAKIIKKLLPKSKFIFSIYNDTRIDIEDSLVVKGLGRAVIRHSDVVITASGTATLEAAIEGKPAIVLYLVSELTYYLGRLLIKLPFVSLPNIILRRMIYPEYIQHINYNEIAKKAVEFLDEKDKFKEISKILKEDLRGRYDEDEVIRRVLQL